MYIWQVLCESSSFGGALVQLETMSEKTALVSHLQTTYESKPFVNHLQSVYESKPV